MDTTWWYGILAIVSILIAVALRFGIYTILVKFNRWLPERATKVANVSSMAAGGVALLALVGNFLLSKH
ncbi:MAG: hypothetical protein DKT66_27830 [Candidatus Melainabacteria bacterium]|jgi:hypothetical protein|nr:MAG: hypothetical protein DKT66_27830 [Candidatus Melainabacteria bacterium]